MMIEGTVLNAKVENTMTQCRHGCFLSTPRNTRKEGTSYFMCHRENLVKYLIKLRKGYRDWRSAETANDAEIFLPCALKILFWLSRAYI